MVARGLIGAVLLAGLLLAACGAATPTVAPATPTPIATAETTPPPIVGSGTIEFGASFNKSTLGIVKPASRFKTTSKAIAYVVHLSEEAGATTLTLSLTRKASGGAETTIVTTPIEIANPQFDTFANSADLATLADRKAGTFVLRYIREGKVLAEGTFTLVE